jgi:hypothetical protein
MSISSLAMAKLERKNRDSAAIALAWLGFCAQHGSHSVSNVWANKSHFRLDYFTFRAVSTRVPCVPVILQFRKGPDFKCRFLKKKKKKKKSMDHSPWSVSLFVRHGFPRRRDIKLLLKFYVKKGVLFLPKNAKGARIWWMKDRLWGYVLKSVPVLQFWHHAIDMRFILLYM